MKYPDKLTLKNLVPSESDKVSLQSFTKNQRLALYNLTSILCLTMYDKDMRAASEALREIVRQNTFNPQLNKCDFDMTDAEKKLEQNPIILSSKKSE